MGIVRGSPSLSDVARMPPISFRSWLKSFLPAPVAGSPRERLRACVGALLAIALTGLVTHHMPGYWSDMPWLIAPMGASAVLLFAVPASPLAQPWPVFGGNVIAALTGVTCMQWIPQLELAAATAVALSIAMMFVLRCIHPPAGAVALTAVLSGDAVHAAGYRFVLAPVAINTLLMLVTAIAYHALTRYRYPHVPQPSQASTGRALGFTSADLDLALKNYNEALDVDRGDLEIILREAEANAYRRRFGEVTCGSVMSTSVVSVHFGDHLEDAWRLMQRHRVKALPVIDRSRRIIGIITLADFLKHTGIGEHSTLAVRLKAFVRRVGTEYASKPDVVGQIMTRRVQVVSVHRPVLELVPLFAELGHHHIPVIDEEQRLVGMITQSDLILALYNQRLRESVSG
jgi:CBS domain-containing membrane protein